MHDKLILLMGYRKGAVDAVAALGYPFLIWDDKKIPLSASKIALFSLQAPFPDRLEKIPAAIIEKIAEYSPSHIIAVKEKAVMGAAHLREKYHLPGVHCEQALRCHDKYLMKLFAKEHDIPITPFILTKDNEKLLPYGEKWGYPLIAKPRNSSGRRGLRFIKNPDEKIPKDMLLEKRIEGSEGSIESFIVNGDCVFENITQYYELMHINIIPGAYSDSIKKKILDFNQSILKLFNIQNGMTHVEFYLTQEGLVFGEIAIRPPGGYILELMSHLIGYSAWELFIKAELNIPFSKPQYQGVASSYILHPGAGHIKHITGEETVLVLDGVIDYKCRLKAGMEIKPRMGVGEDLGRILLKSQDHPSLLEKIDFIRRHLKIECLPKTSPGT